MRLEHVRFSPLKSPVSVTLVTTYDISRLHMLDGLCSSWGGHLSAAVYQVCIRCQFNKGASRKLLVRESRGLPNAASRVLKYTPALRPGAAWLLCSTCWRCFRSKGSRSRAHAVTCAQFMPASSFSDTSLCAGAGCDGRRGESKSCPVVKVPHR